METTKNEMPLHAKQFFNKLSNYLDTKIYFYGSIQRDDYFPESSDIDADIFTDNESSTISKLQNYLGVKKYDFRKFVYRLNKTKKIVYGRKVKYEDPDNNFFTEISIYNEKDKEYVLIEHQAKMILPIYISYLLIFLKFFYYNLGIVSNDTYTYFKRIIMNYMVDGTDVEFITTEVSKPKKSDTIKN
jgi:hypothetical protein